GEPASPERDIQPETRPPGGVLQERRAPANGVAGSPPPPGIPGPAGGPLACCTYVPRPGARLPGRSTADPRGFRGCGCAVPPPRRAGPTAGERASGETGPPPGAEAACPRQ